MQWINKKKGLYPQKKYAKAIYHTRTFHFLKLYQYLRLHITNKSVFFFYLIKYGINLKAIKDVKKIIYQIEEGS